MYKNLKTVSTFWLAVFFIIVDRLLKTLAIGNNYEFKIFSDFLKFTYVENINIAFSIPFSGIFLNASITIILISLMIYAIVLMKSQELIKLSLVVSTIFGAASNLFDRFRYGFVIDYFDIKYFSVLNIADIMISLSLIILCGILLFEERDLEDPNF